LLEPGETTMPRGPIFWIVPALILGAAICSDGSSAQAPGGGKAPAPSQDLSDVCAKMIAPEIKSEKDIQKLQVFLKERSQKTTRCADMIKHRITDLLKGDQPWSFANEQIVGVIKLAHDLANTIEGANGVREQVVLLIAKVESDAKRVPDQIPDPAKQKKVQESLQTSGKMFKDALKQVDDAAKQLKDRAYDLEKRRPELAFEWQLENYKAIAMAVTNLADDIKSQADALGRAVPTDLAKVQP
jgi:hypothetical protein